jgi:hypothetical protein
MSAYRITLPQCGALSYIVLASSSCLALIDALARHGQQAVVVKPLRAGDKGAA